MMSVFIGILTTWLGAVAVADVPGEELLRKGQRRELMRALDLSSLEALPAYQLDVSVSDVDATYSGRGTVSWTNTRGEVAEWAFQLESNGASRGGGTLAVRDFEVVDGPAATWSMVGDTRGLVRFERALEPGERVSVRFAFDGELKRIPKGSNNVFGQMSSMDSADFGLLGQGDGLLTVAVAYPALAPPGDDGPAPALGDRAWNEMSRFEARVVTPVGLAVVSNLVDSKPEPLGEGVQVVRCAGLGVREFVFSASRDFGMVQQDVGGVAVRSWFLEKDREAGEATLADAVATLQYLEARYGAYPWTELDVVESSLVGGAGGMEFSSMVVVGAFLYRDPTDADSPLAAQLKLFEQLGGGLGGGKGGNKPDLGMGLDGSRRFTVAHEVAHQWSPGLAGADAVQHAIIDEPLAQYLAARAVAEMGTDGNLVQVMRKNAMLSYAMMRVMERADGSAERATGDFEQPMDYAGLVYGKAPYLYRLIEIDLGTEVVDAAIARAIADHRWRVAQPDGWIASLVAGGVADAQERRVHWWHEAHGDADLSVDDKGVRALTLLLGDPRMAKQLEQSLAIMGMTPAEFVRAFMGGMLAPAQGGGPLPQPNPGEMLDMLDHDPVSSPPPEE